jgi:mannose/fructose/N-acetylgalactosamine-specific phosphotransferase system component IIC
MIIINWLFSKADKIKNKDCQAWAYLILIAFFSVSFLFISWELFVGIISILPFAISVLIVSEIFFWLEKPKPEKNTDKMEFTFKRKILNAINAYIINGYAFLIFTFRDEIINFFIGIYLPTMMAIMWLGVAVLGIVSLYVLLWLNSKKYRNIKYPKKSVKKRVKGKNDRK